MDNQRDFGNNWSDHSQSNGNCAFDYRHTDNIPGFIPPQDSSLARLSHILPSMKNSQPLFGDASTAAKTKLNPPNVLLTASRVIFEQGTSVSEQTCNQEVESRYNEYRTPPPFLEAEVNSSNVIPEVIIPNNKDLPLSTLQLTMNHKDTLDSKDQRAPATRIPASKPKEISGQRLTYQIGPKGIRIKCEEQSQLFPCDSPQYQRLMELYAEWRNALEFRQKMKDTRRTGWRGSEIFSIANQENIRHHRRQLNREMRKLVKNAD